MKTKAELQQDILNIAMKIQIEFPELTKHIKENFKENISGCE